MTKTMVDDYDNDNGDDNGDHGDNHDVNYEDPYLQQHIAMLYFSVLWMLKYSIGWRPSIWGGQIVSAIAEAVLDISLPIFLQNV